MSDIEGGTSDLQTAVDTSNANKQNIITTAPAEGGQVVLDGVSLNKIGIRGDTLARETRTKVIKLKVDQDKIQERLTPITDATNSKPVLSGTIVHRSK